jgi:hypothetical protein
VWVIVFCFNGLPEFGKALRLPGGRHNVLASRLEMPIFPSKSQGPMRSS